MNKSLLMLLAVAIMGSNLAMAKAEKKEKKSCWSCCTKKDDTKKSGWCDLTRCDGHTLKKCDDKETPKKL